MHIRMDIDTNIDTDTDMDLDMNVDKDMDMDIHYYWTNEVSKFQSVIFLPTEKEYKLAPRYKFCCSRRYVESNLLMYLSLHAKTGVLDIKDGVYKILKIYTSG